MPSLVYVDRILDLSGRESVVLGRHRDCDMQIDDNKASRQHCRIEVEAGIWYVRDLDSANGTLLNGRPVHGREKLNHEDIIAVGAARVQMQMPESADAPEERVRRTQARAGVLGNPDTLIGRSLGGFVLKRVTGRSPVGAIFRADQAALRREAAVTIIAPEAIEGAGSAAAALAALKAQALPSDPGLPERYDCGLDAELGAVWIAGAVLEGDTLGQIAARGNVGVVEALLLCERVAKVLNTVHSAGSAYGLLDGDAAILDGEGRVRLRDPGVAAALGADSASGDSAFRCPESGVSVQGDLYAMGCLLHLLLTGRTPYRASSVEAWKAAHRDNPIPSIADTHKAKGEALDHLLQGLLAKNPEWRYHSVDEYLAEARPLREAIAAAPVKTATPSPAAVQRAAERVAARPTSSQSGTLVLVIVIAVLAGGGYVVLQQMQADPAPGDAADQSRVVMPMMGSQRKDPPLPSERPRPTPVPVQATPPPTPTPPPVPPGVDWQAVRAAVEADLANGDFGAAELAARAVAAEHPGDRDATLLVERVRREGASWYQDRIAELPGGSSIAELLDALRRLQRLEDTALSADRKDATTRSQEVQQRLRQNLAVARRDARLLIEGGRSGELTGLLARIRSDFRAAPPLTELRSLIAQCTQAGELPTLLPQAQTWGQQQVQAEATAGKARLAMAAAFLLVGNDARAKTLLASDASLAEPALVRLREALYGREAAVLDFESPADLQFIETVLGEPRFSGGALDGAVGAPASFACAVPIGGTDWEVRLVLHLANAPNEQAELRLACRNGDREDLSIRIDSEYLRARVRGEGGWAEQTGQRPSTAPLRLSLRCTAGTLVIRVGDEDRFTVREARIGLGAKVLIEVGGAVWRLDDLVVVGG